MKPTKIYDKTLDETYGRPAEEAVSRHLIRTGWEVQDYPFGEKDIDILARRNGTVALIEVERRTNWRKGDVFPYETIHIPLRKERFLTKHETTNTYYWVVRDDLGMVAVLTDHTILRSKKITQWNRLTVEPDAFFNVPRDEVSLYLSLVGE